MLEYWFTVLMLVIIFILGIMALRFPIMGIMGIIVGLLSLTGVISSHTVIMGYMYNSTSGLVITITQDMPELMYIGLVDMLWIAFSTVIGVFNRKRLI